IVALQARSNDAETIEAIRRINDVDTLLCLDAEREFLRRLDGDCDSPVGVLATLEGDNITLAAQVFYPPSTQPSIGKVEARREDADVPRMATKLMEQINGG
ncbi:MAG: hypothetical protein ABR526_03370, partial [Chthoniobacterales bacterium]